jgi:MSHA biogenesis protein MshN
MSVINQVLLELEKRRASGSERGKIPDYVRTLPEGGGDKSGWWLAVGGAAAMALLLMAWLAVNGYGVPRQLPAAAVAPAEVGAVIEKVISASDTVAPVVRAPVETGPGRSDTLSPSARLSFELSPAPAPRQVAEQPSEAARPQGAIAAARALGPAAAASGAPAETGAATAAAMAPPSGATKEISRPPASGRLTTQRAVADKTSAGSGAQAEIDKQVRNPSARDLADHEYRKASTLLQQGRLADAQEGFRAALNLYPAHHAARQAMVALMLQGKMHGDAERALQDGLKVAPEQIGFAMTLARLQVDRGDVPGATATLQSSAAHAQGSPDYAAFLAALLQRQGRHEEAIEKFSAALRGKPNTGVWWLGLGMSLQAMNRGAEAQEAYRRAKAGNINPELAAYADQRLRQLQ